MPRTRLHILAGVLWVVASVVLWFAVLRGVAAVVLIPATPWLRSSGWMEAVGNTYNIVVVAGAILIPSVVAYLAVGWRVPWTAERASNRHGFPVERPSINA